MGSLQQHKQQNKNFMVIKVGTFQESTHKNDRNAAQILQIDARGEHENRNMESNIIRQ